MAAPDKRNLTFLRGSGFLIGLIGSWDLMADETGHWPAQQGFVIFDETKIIAVLERNEAIRRGIEGTYGVEDNRIILTEVAVDTAPERGAPGDMEFAIDGDVLTITWLTSHQVDTFRRRPQPRAVLLSQVEIYESGGRAHNE
jgi:hypothetical protein